MSAPIETKTPQPGSLHPAGWAAIETAPKDGTRLLLWSERDGVEVGEWSTSVWTYGGAWIIYENRSDTIDLKPTHWMPLPLPPNAGAVRQSLAEGAP